MLAWSGRLWESRSETQLRLGAILWPLLAFGFVFTALAADSIPQRILGFAFAGFALFVATTAICGYWWRRRLEQNGRTSPL